MSENKEESYKAAKIKLWTWFGGNRSHRASTLKVQKGEISNPGQQRTVTFWCLHYIIFILIYYFPHLLTSLLLSAAKGCKL